MKSITHARYFEKAFTIKDNKLRKKAMNARMCLLEVHSISYTFAFCTAALSLDMMCSSSWWPKLYTRSFTKHQ